MSKETGVMFTSHERGLPPLAVFVEAAGSVLKKLFAMELSRGGAEGGASETFVARVPMAPAGLTMMELRMPKAAAERLAEMWTGEVADEEMAGDAVRELAETIAAVGYGKRGGVMRCGRVENALNVSGDRGVACHCEAGSMWLGLTGGEA